MGNQETIKEEVIEVKIIRQLSCKLDEKEKIVEEMERLQLPFNPFSKRFKKIRKLRKELEQWLAQLQVIEEFDMEGRIKILKIEHGYLSNGKQKMKMYIEGEKEEVEKLLAKLENNK